MVQDEPPAQPNPADADPSHIRFRKVGHRSLREQDPAKRSRVQGLVEEDALMQSQRPRSFGDTTPPSEPSLLDVPTGLHRRSRVRTASLDSPAGEGQDPMQSYGTFHGRHTSPQYPSLVRRRALRTIRSSVTLDMPDGARDPAVDSGLAETPGADNPEGSRAMSVFDTYPRDDFTPFEAFSTDQSYRAAREATRRQASHVGMAPALRQRLAFYIDTSRVGRIWDLVDALINLIFVMVYIWNTQYVTEKSAMLPLTAQMFDMGAAWTLLLLFLPRYYLAVDFSQYFFSYMSLVTLLATLPPILAFFWAQLDQSIEDSFMSADLLIFVYPLRIIRLQMTVFNCLVPVKNGIFAFSAITRKALRLACGILFTLLTVSAFVHMVTYIQRKPTDALLDFGEAFFFTTVSSTSGLSTNLVPDNTFTRIVILYIMIVGAVFIPTNLSELLTLMSRTSKYPTHFTPATHQSHVLLVGKMEPTSLFEFLREFFCEDHGLITVNTVVVIMDNDEPSEDVANILADPSFVNRVKYVRGSPTSFSSLNQVGAHRAKACFLLTNKVHQTHDPEVEDATIVMYALAIKKYSRTLNKRLKLYAQVLIPETETHLEYLATRTICVDELRLGLLAQSCIVPGFASLMHLLTTSITDSTCDQILESLQGRPRMSWIREYIRGATQEIYPITFSEFLVGRSFNQVAETLYAHFGATLFALRLRVPDWETAQGSEQPTGKKWLLVINPSNHILQGDETGFIIATTSETAEAISKFGAGYTPQPATVGTDALPPEYQPLLFGSSDFQSIPVAASPHPAPAAGPSLPSAASGDLGLLDESGVGQADMDNPSRAIPAEDRAPTLRSIPSIPPPKDTRPGSGIDPALLTADTAALIAAGPEAPDVNEAFSDYEASSSLEQLSPGFDTRKADLVFMAPSDDGEDDDDDSHGHSSDDEALERSRARRAAPTQVNTGVPPPLPSSSTAGPSTPKAAAGVVDDVASPPSLDRQCSGPGPAEPESQATRTRNAILKKNLKHAEAAAMAEMGTEDMEMEVEAEAEAEAATEVTSEADTKGTAAPGDSGVSEADNIPRTCTDPPLNKSSSAGAGPTPRSSAEASRASLDEAPSGTERKTGKTPKFVSAIASGLRSVFHENETTRAVKPAEAPVSTVAAAESNRPMAVVSDPPAKESSALVQSAKKSSVAPVTSAPADPFYTLPRNLTDHLVICDTGTTFPPNLEYFISCIRAPHRRQPTAPGPTRSGPLLTTMPVVILTKNEPDPVQQRLLQNFGQVYMVRGSALIRKDLFRAKIHLAEKAVILSGLKSQSSDVSQRTADSSALLAVLNIESLAQDGDFFIVVEFIHRENMKFVGESETVPIDEVYAQAVLRPSFMSGHVFAPCMLDTLICQTYYNNHLLDIVKHLIFSHRGADDSVQLYASPSIQQQQLAVSSESNVITAVPSQVGLASQGKPTPSSSGPPPGEPTQGSAKPQVERSNSGSGASIFSTASSIDENEVPSAPELFGHMFLISVPESYIGRLYLTLFTELCRNHHAIALGLYRAVSHNKHPLCYVLVNPGSTMALRRGDRVYVLSSREPNL